MNITKKEFQSMMDHSSVSPEGTFDDIAQMCRESRDNQFPSANMLPCYVEEMHKMFGDTVNIGSSAGFWMGAMVKEVKIAEAVLAVQQGATRMDPVINVSMLLSGEYEYCRQEMIELVAACKAVNPDVVVKIIVEFNLLNYEQKLQAIQIVLDSGADFIKTNTGFSGYGARVSDIRLIKEIVGDRVRIKAAGDSEEAGQALELLNAGACQIGNRAEAIWQMMSTFDQYAPHFNK